jgi:non-specific serine/threonine protein kinase/serine/threonine-protein kinase
MQPHMTSTTDWPTIEALFDAAWDVPAQQREAWLRGSGKPAAIIDEVLRLLAAADASDEFLAPTRHPEAASPTPALSPGEVAGAWRVAGLLGRGGMGEVYEVERADGQYGQRAALKRIARVDAGDWARFHNERRIVALLDHPGIARMIDGGLLGDGQPYMVMEYVDGLPIHQWCEQRQASPRERIALVLQACEAVAHAHARLVVHRDIKPSNLLVDGDGRVRLIDFGVATLSGQGEDNGERAPLSLGYAAPEQLAGGEVGVAADIHGMAAVLYRLLCGHAPHARDEPPTALLAMRAAQANVPRLREAAATSPITADKRLLLDLDAVLAMAMARDPAQRYRSMDALADDLSRALRGAPVAARNGEPRYRFWRFLHTHRWAATGASVTVLALAVGLGMALFQAREAGRQRDEALREKARLEAVQQAVFHMFRSAGEMQGSDATAGEVLDHAAQRVVDSFARDPAEGAPVLHTLGELYFMLNDYPAAEPLLQRLADGDPKVVDPSLVAVARYDLAQVALRGGDAKRATALLAQARAFWTSEPARWQSRLIDSLMLEARLRQQDGDADGAIALLQRGLAQRIALDGAHGRETGVFHNNLGVALFGLGRLDEARNAFRAASEVWRVARLQQSTDALNTLNNWGSLELSAGKAEVATPLLEQAVSLRRQLYGPSAATAALLNNYGKLLLQTERAGEALPLLAEAAAMGSQFAGVGSMHHVAALSGVAEAQLLLGNPDRAEVTAREALAAADQHLGAGHPGGAAPRLALVRIHLARDEHAPVAALLDAVDAMAAAAGPAGQRIAAQSASLRAKISPAPSPAPGTTTRAP